MAAVTKSSAWTNPCRNSSSSTPQDTLTLNFGDSFFLKGQDVKTVICDRIWPTMLLVATSTIASAALGLIIGIYAGWRRGSKFDVGSQGVTLFVYSMPEFWFGILVLMAFAGGIGPFPSLFPAGGYSTPGADVSGLAHVSDVLNHLALPWFVLVVAYMGSYSLIMRNSLIDVMNDDFVMTARAKGVRREADPVAPRGAERAPADVHGRAALARVHLRRRDHGRVRVLLPRVGLADGAGDRIARTSHCSRVCSCCSRRPSSSPTSSPTSSTRTLDPRVRAG